MSPELKRGAISGFKKAWSLLVVALFCYLISFFGTGDTIGLLRVLAFGLAGVAVILVVANAWRAHENSEALEFRHSGYEDSADDGPSAEN